MFRKKGLDLDASIASKPFYSCSHHYQYITTNSWLWNHDVHYVQSQDAIGVSLHNGLWAPLFSLGAGTCMWAGLHRPLGPNPCLWLWVSAFLAPRTWWWDSWVEPNNLYPLFQPFSQFVSRLPLATQNSWVRAEAVASVSSVRAWSMVGEGEHSLLLLWVQDQCHTWSSQHKGARCQERSGVQVEVHGCTDGSKSTNMNVTTGQSITSWHLPLLPQTMLQSGTALPVAM